MSIPSNLNLPSSKQIPDHSILDINGKQVYLGNSFICPVPHEGYTINDVSHETAMICLQNPANSTKSLFLYIKNISSADTLTFRIYSDPVIPTNEIQRIDCQGDTSGSLNSTYFLISDSQDNDYYVWYNINSAGVDPTVADRTGIEVAAATNATSTQIATATSDALEAVNMSESFSCTNIDVDVLSVTNIVAGYAVPAADSSEAPTMFLFAVLSSPGDTVTPVNQRLANANTSVADCLINVVTDDLGTFIQGVTCWTGISSISALLILDPGQTLMFTVGDANSSQTVFPEIAWYEL